MNGFDNIKERVELRQQFKDETGDNWENSQGEPDIDYVLWLENRALKIADVVGQSDSPLIVSMNDVCPHCSMCFPNHRHGCPAE